MLAAADHGVRLGQVNLACAAAGIPINPAAKAHQGIEPGQVLAALFKRLFLTQDPTLQQDRQRGDPPREHRRLAPAYARDIAGQVNGCLAALLPVVGFGRQVTVDVVGVLQAHLLAELSARNKAIAHRQGIGLHRLRLA